MIGFPGDALDWRRDGADWPNRAASRFPRVDGMRWHVQIFGDPAARPTLLLLHGAGAATHSWADLAPLLAERFAVVAPDLPGHGFTETPWITRLSLPGMAAALGGLLDALSLRPVAAIGHSAGAAIAARMALDGRFGAPSPALLIGLNPALSPFPGPAGLAMPAMASMLALNPAAPRLFAWSARYGDAVRRLLEATGSTVGAAQHRYYERVMRSPAHVSATLAMLAQWDLAALARDLPRIASPAVFVVGAEDRMIPPSAATAAAERLQTARVETLPSLGHLAHEEAPARVAALCLEALDDALAPRPAEAAAPEAARREE